LNVLVGEASGLQPRNSLLSRSRDAAVLVCRIRVNKLLENVMRELLRRRQLSLTEKRQAGSEDRKGDPVPVIFQHV
jgi:hypothetical protein